MEINITEAAKAKIREFAKANNEKPVVRIYIEKANCFEARFGIAIDTYKEGDEITQSGDIKILTDREYIPKYSKGINIDYTTNPKEGFMISSSYPVIREPRACCSFGGCRNRCTGCSKNQ